jgi:hypothetical protein
LENIRANLPSAEKEQDDVLVAERVASKNVVSPMPKPKLLREFRTLSEPTLSV